MSEAAEIICPECKIKVKASTRICDNCGYGPLAAGDTSFPREQDTFDGFAPDEIAPERLSAREAAQAEDVILLQYQHPFLYAGKHGCIPLRLTNLSGLAIKKISFSIDCKAFHNFKQSEPVEVNLMHGQVTESLDCDFDIRDCDGHYNVRIFGVFLDARNKPHAFRGRFQLLIRDSKADKASIIVRDGAAASFENIDLTEIKEIIVDDGAAGDLNFCGGRAGYRAAEWLEIIVEEDSEQSAMLREWGNDDPRPFPLKGISGIEQASRASRAFLSFTDQTGVTNIQVWTDNHCRVGRSPDSADLVCVVLPVNTVNNEKNQLISKHHCSLKIEQDRVMLEDTVSRNGTFINGQRLSGALRLKSGQVVSLANVVSLRYHDFRRLGEAQEINRVMNNCRTMLDCTTALSNLSMETIREKAPIDAFLFRRLEPFQAHMEYLFLRSSAMIGASATSAVMVRHASVSDQHARLLLFGGKYYLEDLDSLSGTRVNGKRLKPRLPELLGKEDRISIGNVELTFRLAG